MTASHRKAAWLLSAVVLFLAASAYVHLLQSRVDERIAFIRSMPVASGAVPVDHGVRGSMFCVSPSCEGVVAYATFRYPDMTTLCRDVERLKTEWPGVSDVSPTGSECSWVGRSRLAHIAVTGSETTDGPKLYVRG